MIDIENFISLLNVDLKKFCTFWLYDEVTIMFERSKKPDFIVIKDGVRFSSGELNYAFLKTVNHAAYSSITSILKQEISLDMNWLPGEEKPTNAQIDSSLEVLKELFSVDDSYCLIVITDLVSELHLEKNMDK